MYRYFLIAGVILLTACTPTRSSRELSEKARASYRFDAPSNASAPLRSNLDVEQRRELDAESLERAEIQRRRREDLDRRY